MAEELVDAEVDGYSDHTLLSITTRAVESLKSYKYMADFLKRCVWAK